MDNSVYVALSKQVGAQRELQVIANNIANANTNGFKSEEMVFQEYLVGDAKGRSTTYTQDVETIRNTTQGRMEQTGNQFDLAINGPGYFAVQTENGERYTRAGNFTLNPEGILSTMEGFPVVSSGGAQIQFQERDASFIVYSDGRVEVNGEPRESIGVFQFEDEQRLTAVGNNLYAGDGALTDEGQALIAQGFLEKSNVNPVAEITNMVKLQRRYEGTSRFISDLYQIQEDAIRRIARQS